jgi:hypothetical protein
VLPAVLLPAGAPESDCGDSDSLRRSCGDAGLAAALVMLAAMATVEFFRVVMPLVLAPLLVPDMAPFLAARVEAPPPIRGTVAPEPRLRFLITSVFRERGRTTP